MRILLLWAAMLEAAVAIGQFALQSSHFDHAYAGLAGLLKAALVIVPIAVSVLALVAGLVYRSALISALTVAGLGILFVLFAVAKTDAIPLTSISLGYEWRFTIIAAFCILHVGRALALADYLRNPPRRIPARERWAPSS